MLNLSLAERLAHATAGQYGVKMKPGTCWETDIQKKIIYYPPADLMLLDDNSIVAIVLHEVGHIRYSKTPKDTSLAARIRKMYGEETYHEIVNCLDDVVIESHLAKAYPGAGEIIGTHNAKIMGELAREVAARQLELEAFQLLLLQMVADIQGYVVDFTTKSTSLNAALELAKLWELKPPTDTHGVQDFIEAHIALFERYLSPKLKGETLTIDLHSTKNALELLAYAEYKRDDGKGYEDTGIFKERLKVETLSKEGEEISRPLIRKLRAYLKENAHAKLAGYFRTGDIPKRGLYQARLGKEKILTRPVERGATSYAATLLVDASGSMGKERLENAMRAALALSHALFGVRIAHSVKLFSGTSETLKKKTERGVLEAEAIANSTLERGRTHLWDAAKEALAEMVSWREERKLLIIITDDNVSSSDRQLLLAALAKSKARAITAHILKIGGKNLTTEWSSGTSRAEVVACEPVELPTKIVELLGRKIAKGGGK